MELINQDIETQRWSYEENTKVVRQLRKAHTRAREENEILKLSAGVMKKMPKLCHN